MAIVRMRTIKQCYEHLHKEDPESSISEYYIRMLVKQNKVPVFLAGRKQLINLDKLIEYLNSEPVEDKPITAQYGVLRRVGEK